MVVEELVSVDGNKVVVLIDEDCASPREHDNVGVFLTWDRKSVSPDKNSYKCGVDFEDACKSWDVLILPVYKYEHGVVIFSTTPFSCPFDSGQVGYIYCEKDKVVEVWGDYSPESQQKALNCLRLEVETYSDWANGYCYGFKKYDKYNEDDEEEIDSCYGFIGLDHFKSGLAQMAGITR
jgi:hypothetical protein